MINRDTFSNRGGVEVVMPDGTTAEARPLSVRDQRCLIAAHPMPAPPMRRAVGGSLAPEEPDYKDPGYIDACNAWDDEDALLRAAISLGYAVGGESWSDARAGGSAEVMRAWCGRVLDELGDMVSVEWARAVCKGVLEADLMGLVRGGGKGNSGAPA